AAVVRVRRHEPEVVAQRARERVAVPPELRPRREHGEHRRLDRRYLLEQRHRLRAELACRGMVLAVPLKVEALPPGLEEGVECEVVVLVRALDAVLVVQALRLFADHPPVVAERCEVAELRDVEVGPVRYGREQVGEHVVRRHEGRMVSQLAQELEPLAPAEVDEQRRKHDRVEHEHARRKGGVEGVLEGHRTGKDGLLQTARQTIAATGSQSRPLPSISRGSESSPLAWQRLEAPRWLICVAADVLHHNRAVGGSNAGSAARRQGCAAMSRFGSKALGEFWARCGGPGFLLLLFAAALVLNGTRALWA